MGERTAALAARVRAAGAAFVDAVERLDDTAWDHVPEEGVWSAGKDAEHVISGAQFHQRLVRNTVAGAEPARGGGTRRDVMIAETTKAEVLAGLREEIEASARLVESLDDDSLALSAPPQSNGLPRTLEQVIVGQMIGHYDEHRANLEAKAGAGGPLT